MVLFSAQINDIQPERAYYFTSPLILFVFSFSMVPLLFYLFGSDKKTIPDDDKIDIEEQFKFSRSVLLSVVIALIFLSVNNFLSLNWIFYITYIILLIYLGVFSGYLLTREIKEDSKSSRNLIQLALINSLLLLLVYEYGSVVSVADGRVWVDCRASVDIEYVENDILTTATITEPSCSTTEESIALYNQGYESIEFQGKNRD